MAESAYLPEVRNQYEDYPYPARNPEDDKVRFVVTHLDMLDAVNHYCYGGKRDYSKKFRVLVAGGGTGDSTIFLAEQLRETNAEIVQVDISSASLAIARRRAEIGKLTNITFHHTSLLDVAKLNIGEFDYINCSGVLHHLEDPQAGLDALASVLAPGGAMGIMVYAKYGRSGVYMVQELMRHINQSEKNRALKVDRTDKIIQALPADHWFQKADPRFPDIKTPIGTYDLLLHSQDRAYSIPELYEWVDKSHLKIARLLGGDEKQGNHLYSPTAYITDPKLLTHIETLDEVTQKAIAELMHGRIIKHLFYAVKTPLPLPSPDDLDMVPVMAMRVEKKWYQEFANTAKTAKQAIFLQTSKGMMTIPKMPLTEAVFRNMDGERSLGEIFDRILQSPEYTHLNPTLPVLREEFVRIYECMSGESECGETWLFLRHKSVYPVITTKEMGERRLKFTQ